MKNISESRHFKKEDIEKIFMGNAAKKLIEDFKYHTKAKGHNCSSCQKKAAAVSSNYNICFKSREPLWNENEKAGKDLLNKAREISGISDLDFDTVLQEIYSANIANYCLKKDENLSYEELRSAESISVSAESNLFSKLELMQVVESLSHRNKETDELELMSFEWDVDDSLLFEKWKEAGFPLNWKL
ncbi:MAG: hypothetical protein ABR547_09885 [Halanaerobium sp.]